MSYWRWFGEGGASSDDTLQVDASSDGGFTWFPLERVADEDTLWRYSSIRLTDVILPTEEVCLRFRACDEGARGVTEAAIDDLILEGFEPRPAPPPPPPLVDRVLANRPNPCSAMTAFRIDLAGPGPVELRVFDAGGRLVRNLDSEWMDGGPHLLPWDLEDDQGRALPSGIYFYRMRFGEVGGIRHLVVLR